MLSLEHDKAMFELKVHMTSHTNWHHVKYRICYVILHGMFYQVSYVIILLLTPKMVRMSTNVAGNLQTFIKIHNSSISQYFSVPHLFKKLLIFILLLRNGCDDARLFLTFWQGAWLRLRSHSWQSYKILFWYTKMIISPQSTYTIKCALNGEELELFVHLYCIILV